MNPSLRGAAYPRLEPLLRRLDEARMSAADRARAREQLMRADACVDVIAHGWSHASRWWRALRRA